MNGINKIKRPDINNLNFSQNNLSINSNINNKVEMMSSGDIENISFFDILDDFIDSLKKNILNKYYIFSINSNRTDQFGANQGTFVTDNAKLLKDSKVKEIIKTYFPEATIEQMEQLLISINNVGCGYAALTNSIFCHFTGKEEEFEEAFGFPMYTEDENGNINFNYEYLMLDIFCFKYKDNSAAGTDLSPLELTLEDPETYTEGSTGMDELDYFEAYLQSKGLDGSAKLEYFVFNEEIYDEYYSDTENYHKIDEIYTFIRDKLKDSSEEIIINVGGGQFSQNEEYWTLYEYNNRENDEKKIVNPGNVGHAMSIVGITEDNKLIVSSWGKQYILEVSSEELLKMITVVNIN